MSKHKKSGKKHSSANFADVTIYDYANSEKTNERIKKATTNVAVVLKQFETEKTWDDKDEEFEGEFVEKVDEDGNVTYVIEKPEGRRRKKTTSSCEDKQNYDNTGNEYPLDIWFLLSQYIRPEDVGRFAGICKTSYFVVNTARFWKSMYKRYYQSKANLPGRLQPESLFPKYGLRAQVIRALHFMYDPFVNRIKSIERNEHPEVLKRYQCISMWTKNIRKECIYYFKMQLSSARNQKPTKPPDLLQILDDISANQDDGCRILQVTCNSFIPIAPVLGLTLTSAQLNLSSELRYHKLQLWFGSEIQSLNRSTGGNGSTLIILQPVINVKILDWWHPLFPHKHSIEHLFNQE